LTLAVSCRMRTRGFYRPGGFSILECFLIVSRASVAIVYKVDST
jgi:hypothetical protein